MEDRLLNSGEILEAIEPTPSGQVSDPAAEPGGWTVTICRDPRELTADWLDLETKGVCSAYQRFGFVTSWLETIAVARAIEPMIVCVRRGNRCAMLLPLAVEISMGVRLARFVGGVHANHNLPLFDPRLMADVSGAQVKGWLDLAARRAGLDGFVFERQPLTWNGHANPFAAALETRPTPTIAQNVRLEGAFDALLARHHGPAKRRNQKNKEKMLLAQGGFDVQTSSDPVLCHAILDTFFAQKASRLAAQGIADPFERHDTREFFHRLVADRSTPPLMELTWLTVNGKVAAIFGCGVHGDRQTLMILSIDNGDLARASPGKVLLYRLLERLAGRGVRTVDFGVGQELYKDSWADETFPLVDAQCIVTPRGGLYIAALRLRLRLEKLVRDTPAVWSAFKAIRRRLAGRASVRAASSDEDGR